jgi:hypothetical protein
MHLFHNKISHKAFFVFEVFFHSSIAMFSQKLWPGGIRTRVFFSWGGRDDHYTTPIFKYQQWLVETK